MKIISVNTKESDIPVVTLDCEVGDGYVKVAHGSLPDIDSDFAADKRQEVKEYLERRYNKSGIKRVFSAGTFTTEKIRAAIKDVARVHKLSVGTTNMITKAIDDSSTWTDVMRMASSNKMIGDFVQDNPDVFEEIKPIMFQPRAEGIHASAIIIMPGEIKDKKVGCFDVLPIRKMDNLLVSEISGADIDAIGILKNDVLGIAELTRLSDTLNLIEKEYGVRYSILEIASKYLNDPKVFEVISRGDTQGIFQMGSDGMTKYLKRMKPNCIGDLIAANALFRPATLETGAADTYVRCKNGEIEPEYLWGTYEILKDTYGVAVYQEQFALLVQKIGKLSIGDGVNLVKAISKKKIEKIRKYKDKYFEGVKVTGCPKEAAVKIWETIEAAATYGFNKSHATAYGLTAYVGAWLKTYYPTPFYTVVLRDIDKEKLATLISEISDVGGTKLVSPNVNISGANFVADYKDNKIYWSVARIEQLGPAAVAYIEEERNLFGPFEDLMDFIERIFRKKFGKSKSGVADRCSVTSRQVKNLIVAGAFDEIEHIDNICKRFELLKIAGEKLGFEIEEKDFPAEMIGKDYFWARKQMQVSGYGSIDYEKLLRSTEEDSSKPGRFINIKELSNVFLDYKSGVICASITSVSEKTYKDSQTGANKKMGKIQVLQNTCEATILAWADAWGQIREKFKGAEGHIIISRVAVKWSDYEGRHSMQINKGFSVTII